MEILSAPLRSGHFLSWFASGILGRLASAMAPIGLLIVGSQTYGSVPTGARLAAILSLSAAVAAPARGRLLDLRGVDRGLRWSLWQGTVAGLVVAAGIQWQLGSPWIDVMAAGLGVSLAVIPAGFRVLLPQVVEARELHRASHLDAVGFEIALIAAPAMAAVIAAIWVPSSLYLTVAILTAVAAVVLPSSTDARSRSRPGTWRSGQVGPTVVVAFFLGISGGLLEPGVFARIGELGGTESLAALMLAVIGIGSALGGLLASHRPPDVNRPTAAALLTLYGTAVLVASSVESPWVLGLWLFIAGGPIAPLIALGATLLDRRAHVDRRTWVFTLAASAMMLGTGAGQGLSGLLISSHGSFSTLAAAAAVPLGTALVVLLSRSRR